MIQPPTVGPTVGARTARTPASVVAIPCKRGGNSQNTAVKTPGINVPPAKPCTTRQAMRSAKLPLMAQPTEASVKIEMEMTNSQRIVSKRVRYPVRGIATTSAMR